MLKRLVLAAVVLFSAVTLSARVVEIRKKAEVNPTIRFTGISGDRALEAEVRNFLGVCGWFDPAPAGKEADYELRFEADTARLLRGGTALRAWRIPRTPDKRRVAKLVVDTVIEYTFEQLKVRGFCNSRIAFCAETSPGIRNIFVCDIDGRNIEQITNYRTLNVEPCWSPDGRTLCFSKYNTAGIDIVETTLAKPRRSRIVSSFRGINTGAAVSPDGRYLAVILSPDHFVDLYVLGLHHRERRRLTRGIPVEASPCWSPDGGRLAFVSDRTGSPRIYTMNARGGGEKLLPMVAGGADAVTPAWSSDNKIAYATRRRDTGSYVIAVFDLKSGENRIVTKGGGSWESPEWAADNRQVVCKRTVGGRSELWIVDTLTGRERLLLRTGAKLSDPAWSPCVRR